MLKCVCMCACEQVCVCVCACARVGDSSLVTMFYDKCAYIHIIIRCSVSPQTI